MSQSFELDEELRGARYTDDEEGRHDGEHETLTHKIMALRSAIQRRKVRLAPKEEDEDKLMRKLRLEKEERAAIEKANAILTPEEKEALIHGVDWRVLSEIKESFEEEIAGVKSKNSRGLQAGITEDEFMEDFGPALLNDISEEKLRLWYRSIDDNCGGTISWPELSNYLVNASHLKSERLKSVDTSTLATLNNAKEQSVATVFMPTPIEGATLDDRISVMKRRHKLPMTSITYSNSLDCFYTGSTDGMVHCWNPKNFHTLAVNEPKYTTGPIHKTNSWVSSLVYLPHNHRLAVLQADRSIFVYDTFNYKGRMCHELHRAFATSGKAVRQTQDGAVFYDGRKGAGGRGAAHQADDKNRLYQSNDISVSSPPVTLLEMNNDGILTLDHLGGSSVAGEPMVAGLESGNIEIINLLHGSIRPIKSTATYKIHDQWVTKLKYAPELGGVITASLDESACVVDVEKGAVLQRMTVATKSKPLFTFDYHRFHNVLSTVGGRAVHVWNALTGAKLASLLEHDAPVVQTSINANKWQLYTLTEDKTVKVWDLRTYKPLGTFRDEKNRYPSNNLSVLHWSEPHHMLYSGCTELFGWRPVEIQDRLDAGLVASTKHFAGHLRPINHMIVLPKAKHCIAIDSQTTNVWGAESGSKLADWRWAQSSDDSADRIMCACMDLDELRLLVGTEHGKVLWLNYTNGQILSRLHHNEGSLEVSCVAVVPGVTVDAPPIVYAAAGHTILMWTVDRDNDQDITVPFSSFKTTNEQGMTLALAMADEDRQVVVAATSNGYYLLLTIGLAPLSQLQTGIMPAEHLKSVFPGLWIGCHADGIIRCFGLASRGYDFFELCSWSGAHADDDSITALDVMDDTLIVGDSGGYVSVFKCSKLFNQKLQKYTIIPKTADGDENAGQACLEDVSLQMSFKGHQSTVTGLALDKNTGALITCSLDRQIRRWASKGVGECTHEFGSISKEEKKKQQQQDEEDADDDDDGNELSKVPTTSLGRMLSLSAAKAASEAALKPRRTDASSFPRLIDTRNHSYHVTGYRNMDGGHTLNPGMRKLSFAHGLQVARSRGSTLGELFYGATDKKKKISSDHSSSPSPAKTRGGQVPKSLNSMLKSNSVRGSTGGGQPPPLGGLTSSGRKDSLLVDFSNSSTSFSPPTASSQKKKASLTSGNELDKIGSVRFELPSLNKKPSSLSPPSKNATVGGSSGGGGEGEASVLSSSSDSSSVKRKGSLFGSVKPLDTSKRASSVNPESSLRTKKDSILSPLTAGGKSTRSASVSFGGIRSQSIVSFGSEVSSDTGTPRDRSGSDGLIATTLGVSMRSLGSGYTVEDKYYRLASKPLIKFSNKKEHRAGPEVPYISKVHESILEVAHIKNVRSANESGGNTDSRTFKHMTLPKIHGVMKDVVSRKKEVDKSFVNDLTVHLGSGGGGI